LFGCGTRPADGVGLGSFSWRDVVTAATAGAGTEAAATTHWRTQCLLSQLSRVLLNLSQTINQSINRFIEIW